MKLSTVLIGTMLLAASGSLAQQKNPVKKVESDSIGVIKRIAVPMRPISVKLQTPPDTLKPHPVDSTKLTPIHDPDYCPPCGMG